MVRVTIQNNVRDNHISAVRSVRVKNGILGTRFPEGRRQPRGQAPHIAPGQVDIRLMSLMDILSKIE